MSRPAGGNADASGMDAIIGALLATGVALSAALIAAGLAWQWARAGARLDDSISGMSLFSFWSQSAAQAAAGRWEPRLVVNLGIGLLLATPLLRVAVSALYFAAIRRDAKYTAFTTFVLAVLVYSLFLR